MEPSAYQRWAGLGSRVDGGPLRAAGGDFARMTIPNGSTTYPASRNALKGAGSSSNSHTSRQSSIASSKIRQASACRLSPCRLSHPKEEGQEYEADLNNIDLRENTVIDEHVVRCEDECGYSSGRALT